MLDLALKVLLIEDDEDDYILTSDLLREVKGTKYEITWISKYGESLQAILGGEHDVCLVDYRLGEGNGIQLVRDAIANDCRLPMILLTGQVERSIDIEATEAGAADYLVKGTIDAPLLERSIRYAIARGKMLETLHGSERRFRSVIESANDAIILTDQHGKIVSWNDSASSIFGYSQEEISGRPISTLFPSGYREGLADGGDTDPLIASGFLHSKSKAIELNGVRNDGSVFPLEISFSSWKTADGTFFSGIIRDISERKLMEGQLMRGQKLESIGQLAAGIAHEINTPTQYVGDNVHFLRDSFEDIALVLEKNGELIEAFEKDGLTQELIEEMRTVVDRADIKYLTEEIPRAFSQSLDGIARIAKIVQSMKDFAHPGTEGKQSSDINRAIESTITVASNEWKYVADIETHYDESLPAIPCLMGEVNQVILNMIINATHAIKDVVGDGSNGKGKIVITTKKNEPWAEIRIADTGAGIPENIRQKIFDPFFTTKGIGVGTGQGLAISHSVIRDKHNGTINVESEMGRGSTFIINLPLFDEATAGAGVR